MEDERLSKCAILGGSATVGKMVTGQGMVWVLVGVRGCVAVDTGHGLVTLFSLSGRLRTDRCISIEASHRLIIPSTYLGMGP